METRWRAGLACAAKRKNFELAVIFKIVSPSSFKGELNMLGMARGWNGVGVKRSFINKNAIAKCKVKMTKFGYFFYARKEIYKLKIISLGVIKTNQIIGILIFALSSLATRPWANQYLYFSNKINFVMFPWLYFLMIKQQSQFVFRRQNVGNNLEKPTISFRKSF